MKCKKCGAELADGVLFCRECGMKVEPMKKFCHECGAELPDGVKFCPNCGAKVDVEEAIDGDVPKSKETISDLEKIKEKLINMWNSLEFFYRVVAVEMLIALLMFLAAFGLHKILPIFISILQIGSLIAAVFFHKGILKAQKKYGKYLLLIVSIFLAVLNIMSHTFGNKENVDILEETKEKTVVALQISVGAADCVGKNYSDIENILSENGFTNITLKEMENLKASESDKVGQIENISIDGNTKFDKNQTFQSDSEIVIHYHTYAKCSVNIHVNFVPNLIFSRYDAEFNFDNMNEGKLSHGEDADYHFDVKPGKYSVEFISAESSSVKGETTLEVSGDVNVSYQISCYRDKISVDTEYTENLGELGENEIMMDSSMADYRYENYKDVEEKLKKLGFTNIKTDILYDTELGLTDEGETEAVSINGDDDFKRGDVFSNSAEVIITYHMKAEDDPAKETAAEETERTKAEETEVEIKENLTVDNCPELATMLSNKAEIDESYSEFASKYKGRTIEFDGQIADCTHHENYNTRFDYLITVIDDSNHQVGPYFKFQNVNYSDLHTDLDSVTVGLNVHITAEVENYDSVSSLFYLKPVSVTGK